MIVSCALEVELVCLGSLLQYYVTLVLQLTYYFSRGGIGSNPNSGKRCPDSGSDTLL